jgi:molybdopterin-containing oxidoreductase family membrane subunit
MVFGPYWWLFWIVQLLVGLVVPAALLVPRWGLRSFNFGLAAFLIAIGYAGTKQNIVLPGLAVADFRALPQAFVHDRLSVVYFPSLTEWFIAIGAVGAAALLFVIAIEYLPFLRERENENVIASGTPLLLAREGRAT